VVAGIAMSPHLLGSRVASAVSVLGGADHGWLLAASAGFVAAFACTVGAWRAGFAAAGGRISPRRAVAGLGVGALVNAFAPAKLGDAVKVALCSCAIEGPGRLWTAGGVYAALAAARSLALAVLVVVASIAGAVPLWPVFALCSIVAVLAALDVASAFPITPGSIGIGTGAVAVALASRGIAMSQAIGTGLALQAIETLVSICVGSLGALWLANEHVVVRRWTFRLGAVGGSV